MRAFTKANNALVVTVVKGRELFFRRHDLIYRVMNFFVAGAITQVCILFKNDMWRVALYDLAKDFLIFDAYEYLYIFVFHDKIDYVLVEHNLNGFV